MQSEKLSERESRLRITIDRDVLASSIVMTILCIGMTRNGFASFQISVAYLILISAVFYVFVRGKISLGPYGLDLLPYAALGFILIPVQMIMSDGYYNPGDAFEGAVSTLMMISVIIVVVNRNNTNCLWRIVNLFSLVASMLILVEEVFFLVGIRLDRIAGMNETIFRAFQYEFYRPSGMFSEPSHFAEMGLLSAFYYSFIEKHNIRLAIVACTLIVSTSALGIVGLVLMFLFYSIHYIFGKSIGHVRKFIFIMLLLAGGSFFVHWVYSTENLVVLRILSGGTVDARTNRSFQLYGMLNPIQKLLGIGNANQAYYLNFHEIVLPGDAVDTLINREFAQTFGYILCTMGLVGSTAFWAPFLNMFLRGDHITRTLILIFGFVCITSCINGRSTFLVYMILVFSTYANSKQKRLILIGKEG